MPRPFKVPFSPWFPLLGIICCGGLMIYSFNYLTTSALLFPAWIGFGALIYIHYGYKKNRVMEIFNKRRERVESYKKNDEQ